MSWTDEPARELTTSSMSTAIVPFSYRSAFHNPRLLPSRSFELPGQPPNLGPITLIQRHQLPEMVSEWDAGGSLTGAAVWDAAIVLASYLPALGRTAGGSSTSSSAAGHSHADPDTTGDECLHLSGVRVLEVGCGAGLLAVAAARLGAQVTATDLDERVLQLCTENAVANAVGSRVATARLAWGDTVAVERLLSSTAKAHDIRRGNDVGDRACDPPNAVHITAPFPMSATAIDETTGWDLVLAADCLYQTQAIKPLLETLRAVCAIDPNTTVLVGYKTRMADQLRFFKLAQREGWDITWVPQDALHPDFCVHDLPANPFEAQRQNFLVGDGGGVHVCTMRYRENGNDRR
eukprot:SAG31_NODE_2555_length_5496_cov_13.099314_5_plen_349_part_00